jgi:hypothetical protein
LTLALIKGMSFKSVHSMAHSLICLDAIKAYGKTDVAPIPGWAIM